MSASYQGLINAINPKESKLNILLLAMPICCYFAYISHQETNAFFASLVAIMPLAFLMGHATEEIALRTSDSIGGLLNATFGNAAEIIICLLALWSAYKAGSRFRNSSNYD